MSNSSIWPIDRTLSYAISPGQGKPGSDGNERVLGIPQSSSITGASMSDCHIRIHVGGVFFSRQRCSRCVLQLQPNVPYLCLHECVCISVQSLNFHSTRTSLMPTDDLRLRCSALLVQRLFRIQFVNITTIVCLLAPLSRLLIGRHHPISVASSHLQILALLVSYYSYIKNHAVASA